MIGKGELLEALYVLQVHQLPSPTSEASSLLGKSHITENLSHSIACNIHTNNKPGIDIWHARLGHISDQRLHALKSHLDIGKNKFPYVPHCFVCPLAKQKRLSFDTNNHFCDSIFEIIHCDI